MDAIYFQTFSMLCRVPSIFFVVSIYSSSCSCKWFVFWQKKPQVQWKPQRRQDNCTSTSLMEWEQFCGQQETCRTLMNLSYLILHADIGSHANFNKMVEEQLRSSTKRNILTSWRYFHSHAHFSKDQLY